MIPNLGEKSLKLVKFLSFFSFLFHPPPDVETASLTDVLLAKIISAVNHDNHPEVIYDDSGKNSMAIETHNYVNSLLVYLLRNSNFISFV